MNKIIIENLFKNNYIFVKKVNIKDIIILVVLII